MDPNFTYRIWLFGGLRIEKNHSRVNIPAGKLQHLLTYLLLHPTLHTREHLAEVLWPGLAPGLGRRKLSDALYRLRKSFRPNCLSITRHQIGLSSDPDVWVDARAFSRLYAAGQITSLKQAAALYIDSLMPAIYEDWIVPHRVGFEEKYLACLEQLAGQAERDQNYVEAREYYRQILSLNPLYEAAYRGRMRCLAAAGQLLRALESFQELVNLLSAEMGIEPTDETRRLAHQLQLEQKQQPYTMPPFIGRNRERARLLHLLDRAETGKGSLAVILGEAGIGKSRLVTEVARSARWRGWQVIRERCDEFIFPAAYSPLLQVLESALPPTRLHQLQQGVSSYRLATAASLIPTIASTFNLPSFEAKQSQLAPALGNILRHLGEITPHLLLLEDVQWSGSGFWTLLEALRLFLAESAIILILNGRHDDLRSQPNAWNTITRWDRASVPVLYLEGLERDELSSLTTGRLQENELDELYHASGGNPLLALTLLEEGGAGTPVRLTELMLRRIQDLSRPARIALRGAAVLGYEFEYPHWQAMSAANAPANLPTLAGELERAGMIYVERHGYRFAHDTLRASVYAGIAPDQRVEFHQRALELLRQERPAAILTLLYHAQQAGDASATVDYALRAGEDSLNQLAYQAAVTHFSLALENLSKDADRERYQALIGRIQANHILGERQQEEADTRELQTIANRLASPGKLAEAARWRADLLWLLGRQEDAHTLVQRGLKYAQQAGDLSLEASLLVTLARIARNRGDFSEALQWVQQARSRYRKIHDKLGEATALDKVANLTFEAGDYTEAAAMHQEAARLFRDLDHPIREARTLNGLALAVRALGDYDRSRQIHEEILEIGKKLDDLDVQWIQLVNLGNVAFELGAFATAVARYESALDLIRHVNDPHAEAMVLYNLGETLRNLRQPQRASHYLRQALALNERRGYQRGVALNLQGLGLTFLSSGKPEKARELLTAAQTIWLELDQPLKLMDTNAALALVYMADGDLSRARQLCQSALETLDTSQKQTIVWRRIHFAAYQIWRSESDRALHHLQQAGTAVYDLAATLPQQHRRRFFEEIPLNQNIVAALADHSQYLQIQLARTDAPLGRELTAAERVDVTWTIASPLDAVLQSPAARRRAVLQRLLEEATAQGAAPTDHDLARALNVSRRTVLRLIQKLRGEGMDISTRGRS